MLSEGCPLKVVRTNGGDEVLARASNLLMGRAAFEGCGQLLMYRYFGNSILIDLLPELFPPGFRERERTQA